MTTTVGSVVRSGTRPVDGLEARTFNADASWADAATADDRAIDRLPVRRPSPQNKFYRRHALGRRHGRLEPVHSLENRFATPIEAKAPRDTSRIGGSARPRNLRMFSQQQVALSAEGAALDALDALAALAERFDRCDGPRTARRRLRDRSSPSFRSRYG